jgi:hypothetical protein
MVWLCMCQDDPAQMDRKGAGLELVRRDRVTCAMGIVSLCAWGQRLVC